MTEEELQKKCEEMAKKHMLKFEGDSKDPSTVAKCRIDFTIGFKAAVQIMQGEVDELKLEACSSEVLESTIKSQDIIAMFLKEEITQLKQTQEMLVAEMRHAMRYYKDCGEEADPEFQLYKSFEKALAALKEKK